MSCYLNGNLNGMPNTSVISLLEVQQEYNKVMMIKLLIYYLSYNLQSAGIGDLFKEGKNVCSRTTEESVSNGPVLRILVGGSGFGISVFDNLEMRAFLMIPVAVSSIQPHLTFVGSLQNKLFNRKCGLCFTF